jgi:hypothetical protein
LKVAKNAALRRRVGAVGYLGRGPRNFFSVKVFRMDLEADFKRLFGVRYAVLRSESEVDFASFPFFGSFHQDGRDEAQD